MRTLTRGAVLGGVAFLVVYGVAAYGFRGDEMALPKRVAVPTDGRAVVQLQLCWFPEHVGGVVRSTIGAAQRADVEFDIPCSRPWTTQGLVQHGDRIALGWTMNPPQIGPGGRTARVVDYRVSVNGREVRRKTVKTGNGQFECMAGIPPCVP